MIDELQIISKRLNSTNISYKDINNNSKYSITTYRNHFGTLRNALSEAGFNVTRNWGTNQLSYLENIISVWTKLGRQPKMKEMDLPFSKNSSGSYTHHFGSWTNALKELQAFLENHNSLSNKEVSNDFLEISNPNIHHTKREINLRLRFLVMKRDNFKCCNCGRSPGITSGLELHIDHIKPWSKGGETVIDNLQTLCQDCNLGKSNLE